eukprot:TRINITY_DN3067_c0_g4_i2.p1 TRINITY_DN3067_c0_g4~~TRINITY_DN3067_c0_g4_i2.p1  ORF type:complete len:166 (+),score=20.06 TRINITY_DN3067_c0_g4_i2:219-716(+)
MRTVLLISALFISSVLSFCPPPNQNCAAPGYIGCYYASQDLFPDSPLCNPKDMAQMTVDQCVSACMQAGSNYTALSMGNRCHCGNDYSFRSGLSIDDNECNVRCVGNPAENCGGIVSNVYSVYDSSPEQTLAQNDILYANAMTCIDDFSGDEECETQPGVRYFYL